MSNALKLLNEIIGTRAPNLIDAVSERQISQIRNLIAVYPKLIDPLLDNSKTVEELDFSSFFSKNESTFAYYLPDGVVAVDTATIGQGSDVIGNVLSSFRTPLITTSSHSLMTPHIVIDAIDLNTNGSIKSATASSEQKFFVFYDRTDMPNDWYVGKYIGKFKYIVDVGWRCIRWEVILTTQNVSYVETLNKPNTLVGENNIQTWKFVTGDYDNTNYLPTTRSYAPDAMASLDVYHQEPLPDPCWDPKFRGVVDETHYYALCADGTGSVKSGLRGLGHSLDPILMKFDRFSGKLIKSVRLSDAGVLPNVVIDLENPGETADVSVWVSKSELSSRGPLSLSDDAIYFGVNDYPLVFKFSKEDLTCVWGAMTPKWKYAENVLGQFQPGYRVQQCMPLPKKENIDYQIVAVMTSAGTSYGAHSNAIENGRFIQWHFGRGFVFGLKDKGTTVELEYELSTAPEPLKAGETISDDCFGPGETSMEIWDLIQPGMTFSDGNPITGEPKTSGTFRALKRSATEVNHLGVPVPEIIGWVTFNDGDCLESTATYNLMDPRSPDGTLLSSRTITGAELEFAPYVKVMYKGTSHELTSGEAWGLSHYGCSMYGTNCFDVDTDTMYVGTSNSYQLPYGEVKKFNKAANSEILSGKISIPFADENLKPFRKFANEMNMESTIFRDDVDIYYHKLMHEAGELWDSTGVYHDKSSTHVTPTLYAFANMNLPQPTNHAPYTSSQENGEAVFAKAKKAIEMKKAYELARRKARNSLSPRTKRMFICGVMAFNPYTGELKWGDSGFGDDVRDSSYEFAYNSIGMKYFIEVGPNADVLSTTIARYNGKKKLLVQFKSGFITYDIDDPNVSSLVPPTRQVNYLIQSGFAQFAGFIHDGSGSVYFPTCVYTGGVPFENYHMVVLPKLPTYGSPILDNRAGVQTYMKVDIETGEIQWITRYNAEGRPDSLSLGGDSIETFLGSAGGHSGYGGMIFAGSLNGELNIIDMRDGSIKKRMVTLSKNRGGFPIVNGVGYFVGGDESQNNVSHFMTMFTPYGK